MARGEIIRFYKGKGKKGKFSNERGITLGNNMGKLFERIMNSRLTKTVKITDARTDNNTLQNEAQPVKAVIYRIKEKQ